MSTADRGIERHRYLRIHRARSGAYAALSRLRRSPGRLAKARAATPAGAISTKSSRRAPIGCCRFVRVPDKRTSRFDVVVIGHLRKVKDPMRAALAARHLPKSSRIRIVHLGAAETPRWKAVAEAEMTQSTLCLARRQATRARSGACLAARRAMVLSSLSEGGANVISRGGRCRRSGTGDRGSMARSDCLAATIPAISRSATRLRWHGCCTVSRQIRNSWLACMARSSAAPLSSNRRVKKRHGENSSARSRRIACRSQPTAFARRRASPVRGRGSAHEGAHRSISQDRAATAPSPRADRRPQSPPPSGRARVWGGSAGVACRATRAKIRARRESSGRSQRE